MEKLKFIIDRSIWRTGDEGNVATGDGNTALLNECGYMCCLGMISEQLGVDKDDLLGLGEPEELSGFLDDLSELDLLLDEHGVNTNLSDDAITINDGDLPVEEKEKELIKLFGEHDVELEFIGEVKYKKDLV